MNAPLLLAWLAGTLLPLGALWLLFRVALRAERCFGYNRALLLLAPLVAAGLPLVPRPALPAWLVGAHMAATNGLATPTALLPTLQVAVGQVNIWGIGSWLTVLYLVGVGVGLGRLAYQVWHLRRAAQRLPRVARPGYVLAHTGGQLPTSSFGRTIFWDETAHLTPAEAAAVLAHELAHVRQGHTFDVLWLAAWRAVLWPNPFVHLLRPALRLTHELLADRAAAPAGAASPAAAYPALLARLTAQRLVGGRYSPLLQSFTFSFTLTRIAMLQNHVPVRRWKQWLALPVLGGLLVVAGQPASAQTAPPPPIVAKPEPAPAAGEHKVYTYVDQMPELPGGGAVKAIVQAIQSKISYPKEVAADAANKGMVFAAFTVEADGSVRDAHIIKGVSRACDDAVLAAVRQLPRFIPGRQSGKAVAVSFTVPVDFK